MKVCGVIAEFNPFHNGHLYLVNEIKKHSVCDYTVAVISGNFVQRGEPAICDKWTRTKMCLSDGVDMVLELPVVSASASAEGFASGAVSTLASANIFERLYFGAEDDNINFLNDAANCLINNPKEYNILIKENLKKGISYPLARQNALEAFLSFPPNILSKPNNILAIEYIKALKRLNSTIKPYTIKRISSSYHDTKLNSDSGISSATAIRRAIEENNLDSIKKSMPLNSYEIFCEAMHTGKSPVYFDDFSYCIQYAIRSMSLSELSEISDMSEGLEHRIKNCCEKDFFISDLVMAIKSKRYTFTRIQRILLHILLGITKDCVKHVYENGHGYIRVLGFRKSASPLVSHIVKNSLVPVIINVNENKKNLDSHPLYTLNLDFLATDIFALCIPDATKRQTNLDLTHPIVIV